MLVGTGDPEALAGGAPRLASFASEPVVLPDVEVFQALFEMRAASREPLLPPGLHPTNPATLVLLAWRCPESPWGPFSLLQLRVGCRSGVRTRGLVLCCVCDAERAAKGLAASWGFGARPGDIVLVRRYDRVELRVSLRGGKEPTGEAIGAREALAIEALDPDPLATGDVQYTGTLTWARTPKGLRLVQVEPDYASTRVERLRPRLLGFDADAFGQRALTPYHPVSASIARAEVTLPPVRFVCRPDVLAFEGTERVSA